MKTKLFATLAAFGLITSAALAAQTVPVRMYCLSLQINDSSDQYFDRISLNFAARPESAGELGPFWPVGPSYYDITFPGVDYYGSNLTMYDSYYHRYYSGGMNVSLPLADDLNNNRFPDFFEVALSASSQTSGGYTLYLNSSTTESGMITATWTRAAGSATGNYQWVFYNTSGPLPSDWFGTFSGQFKILQYTGTLTYTPGNTTVSATLNLTSPTNTLQGTILFTKDPSDPHDSLTNQPTILMNGSSQSVNITNHWFTRDPNYPTNYAGYVEFDDDGDLTSVYSYAIWVLSINDPNDSNHNGIPDFSDDSTFVPPPRRPLVSYNRTGTNLLFTIHGDVNHVHEIQQVSSISSANWQSVVSVTLTNDPQVVPVSFPSGPAFYRVRAQ